MWGKKGEGIKVKLQEKKSLKRTKGEEENNNNKRKEKQQQKGKSYIHTYISSNTQRINK